VVALGHSGSPEVAQRGDRCTGVHLGPHWGAGGSVGGAWARREEKESGERRSGGWRGSPFIYGPRGRQRPVIKMEKRPVINGGGNGSI
jgi:hypothetical protein